MPEISLADLLAWEPRLHYAGDRFRGGAEDPALEREVTWAVTIRATPPLLPQVRGGEIVLLPPRLLSEAATESGVTLPGLLHELASHRITAVVLEEMPPAAPLPILMTQPVTTELESELNRLLTQRRGELYRVGTELGRILANLTAAQADLNQIVTAASDVAGYQLTVLDPQGTVIAAAAPHAARELVPMGTTLHRRLTGNGGLRLEAVPPAGQALARLLADRIAVAVDTALLRSERERPRGPAREAALQQILTGRITQPDPAALGLIAGAPLRVVLAGPDWSDLALERELSQCGLVHAAGQLDDCRAFVIEERSGPTRALPGPALTAPAAVGLPTSTGSAWLAFSAPVTSLNDVPGAARQARYVAILIANVAIHGRIIHFDAVAELGLYQLLYPLWGTSMLTEFIAAALGDLPANDRRGVLRETLLAYLAAGGSHVEAATALGIHRNTLTYRLKQVAELTGHNPDDPDYRLAIHVALLAERLPPALPPIPTPSTPAS